MNIIVSVAVCFIPLIAFFICLAILIPGFKFSKGLFSCVLGLISVIPIAAIQFILDKNNLFSAATLGAVLLESLILNGLIEESIKMGLLFLIPHKDAELKDFFAYSLLCGLSVGCFESVIYLISGYENIGLRMVTAVIIHVTCSGLSGLFVYSAKTKKIQCMPFLLSILIHGIYNYFAGFSSTLKFFSIAVILFALIECRLRYTNLRNPPSTEIEVV